MSENGAVSYRFGGCSHVPFPPVRRPEVIRSYAKLCFMDTAKRANIHTHNALCVRVYAGCVTSDIRHLCGGHR